MAEQQQIPEYRQSDTVRLTVELRDANGVRSAGTMGFLEGSGDHSKPGLVDPYHKLEIHGCSEEEEATHVQIVLHGTVEQQTPGVYVCYAVVGENPYGAFSRHDLDPPMRFRIVEHADDIREGPEVLSVGEFW